MEIRRGETSSPRTFVHLLIAVFLALAMFAFGFGVYFAAGYLKASRQVIQLPDKTTGVALPGTIYVVQSGAIYKFVNGSFTAITAQSGFMQPAVSPDRSQLVAVRRYQNWSDLYRMDLNGKALTRLTNNTSSVVEGNHWIFYPRFSADGSRIFYDFDPKDPYNSYRVDLAILSSPAANLGSWLQWTYPNQYTGGDVSPVPLRDGGLIYVRFSIDAQSVLHSQVWLQSRAGSAGVALTDPTLDCIQPAVSADEKTLAVVCRKGQTQSSDLYVGSFNEQAPSLSLVAPSPLVGGQLVASPAFSPDGKTIAYLAPSRSQGSFQLWTVGVSGSPAPKQVTTNLALDSLSAPVWLGK
jgi:Tol biopolymer transport system component